jgi:carboxypeptidase family protein/TonB-dependent receptor-like protein
MCMEIMGAAGRPSREAGCGTFPLTPIRKGERATEGPVRPRRLIILAASLSVWAVPGLAQRQSGSIAGTVDDGQGNRLASVRLVLAGGTAEREAVTDDNGRYLFAAVDPGTYEVRATISGFAPRARRVVLPVAAERRVDFSLPPGAEAAPVEAVGEAPPIDTSSARFDVPITQDMLFRLPFARSITDLPNVAPGAHDDALFGGDAGTSSGLLLDGVEFRDPSSGGFFVFLSYNWLDQVQVMGPGAPAEFGLYTGGIVNSVTRSGGQNRSGLFDVLYGDGNFDAANVPPALLAQNARLGQPQRRTRYLDLTAQMAGPVVPDRLFYFAGLQWRRTVTDPEGPRTDSTNTAPRFLATLRYQPRAVDTFRGLIEHDDIALRRTGAVDDDALTDRVASPVTAWSAAWTRSLGAHTSGELKYTGWSGSFDSRPEVAVTGRPVSVFDRGRHQLNLALSRFAERFGRHDFKFGLEVERSRADSRVHYLGGFAPTSDPREVVAYSYDVTARNAREAVYAQDAWRVRDRLVLALGLRTDWNHGSSGLDGPEVYATTVVQPRIGIVYTADGAGRVAFKAHWGRYGEAALAEIYRRALPGHSDFQPFGIDPTPSFGGVGFNTLPSENRRFSVDREASHPALDEWLLGGDVALAHGLLVCAYGIARDAVHAIGSVAPDDRWEVVSLTNPLDGRPLPAYLRVTDTSDLALRVENPDGFAFLGADGAVLGRASAARRYRGLVFLIDRPWSGHWLARASYVFSRSTGDAEQMIAVSDRGLRGHFESPNSALVNAAGERADSRRHEIKLQAAFEVPRIGVAAGAYFRSLSGGHYTAYQVRGRSGAVEDALLFLEPRGARTLPWQNLLDLRLEKFFTTPAGRLGLYADVTNVFNASTVTDVSGCVPDPASRAPGAQPFLPAQPCAADASGGEISLGTPLSLVAPRQASIGVRLSF